MWPWARGSEPFSGDGEAKPRIRGTPPPTPIRFKGTGAAPFCHSNPKRERHPLKEPLIRIRAAQHHPDPPRVAHDHRPDFEQLNPNLSHRGINIGGVSAVNCYGSLCYEKHHKKPRQCQTVIHPSSIFTASTAEKSSSPSRAATSPATAARRSSANRRAPWPGQ